ncbi:MAG: hypothetical protein AB8B35_07290, partial [Prochlorococcus sp.]
LKIVAVCYVDLRGFWLCWCLSGEGLKNLRLTSSTEPGASAAGEPQGFYVDSHARVPVWHWRQGINQITSTGYADARCVMLDAHHSPDW